ncbi:hypothetical protein HZY62_08620 [Maribacter polysiphoniae]|jgi:hypothetical protein|uniref:Piwi domain-containing protein n=4 Tax=Flavobacteriaceae TaxID=49546 RepID=A0A3G2L4X8_9FLAO|nr:MULTISPECIES: hypothetical protein [Flavobacteriaceae]8FEX_B Chain B, short pAgo [Maribacter polysiphoniae]8FFI_B Chain B, short pAgo [Maribacter polysiphoniae]8FFI_F Chain F, short pAgo [Maribacter polysiphoniae]8FFI_L Chain L, short pAgo [Maribacter polysiphoniae]8FFI_N Chain N, short pAgo [Maribacter polysiphoniae]8I87_B Chain B, Piwi domain-containing protein [Maribacter polysiphoniae]8I87_D Chain D, Piwi domain-containing protein [Maribacter polysiphoniae]8I87_F Chain F, Piwi domain|tara:strand:+ start:41586 stop:43109 length:1524 start_codon:yes stop_codon:yes gene_type:complete
MKELIYIEEPKILFAHGQKCTDARDGLALFGPLNNLYGIKSGVIGTKQGLKIFRDYLDHIQKPIYNSNSITRPMFPGFEAVFDCKWESTGITFKEVTNEDIGKFLYNSSTHKRTYDLVSLFIDKIISANKNEDENVDVWFVIVPDEIYKYCRPNSVLPKEMVQTKALMSKSKAKSFRYEPSLFPDINIELKEQEKEAETYNYDAQFHDQFKARLLKHTIPTQIFRESTLAWRDFKNAFGLPIRDFSKIEGHLAWTISTAAFYKAGGKPWKLSDVRNGVCYLGLVYKKVEKSKNPRNACCAAQMFLDNGDGTVFKGEVGPWYNPKNGQYHLEPKEAKALLSQSLQSYKEQIGEYPKEVFIHAKTRFNHQEWDAFLEVTPKETNLVGVTISKTKPLKLYKTEGDYTILRGNAYVVNERSAFLWTVGYVPKIQTALSMEVPNPLFIEINKGEADIKQVLKDILSLTKLNYNACIFADGEPVTLRFADKIGEILTASTDIKTPPLAFKYYI